MNWNRLKHKLKWFIIETNLFKYTFTIQGFVWLDKYGNPTNDVPTATSVDYLETITVKCRYKDFYDVAIDTFDNMYPKYKGYVNLYN